MKDSCPESRITRALVQRPSIVPCCFYSQITSVHVCDIIVINLTYTIGVYVHITLPENRWNLQFRVIESKLWHMWCYDNFRLKRGIQIDWQIEAARLSFSLLIIKIWLRRHGEHSIIGQKSRSKCWNYAMIEKTENQDVRWILKTRDKLIPHQLKDQTFVFLIPDQ